MLKRMSLYLATFLTLIIQSAITAPPKAIPPQYWNAFTLNGKIPVHSLYFDDSYNQPKVYHTSTINQYIQKANRREMYYYGYTDLYLYQALDELAKDIKGKEICVIGSALPWYESILLAYGCSPVVIEYNPIACKDSRIIYLTPEQYRANPRQFDYILSISSIEHDGLGRYGDPVNPTGDLRAMAEHKNMLRPGGKLILSVPVGPDCLVWNAHRIYGPIRLKMLFQGWRPVKYYGFKCEVLLQNSIGTSHQPIFLLEPKS